MTVGEEKVITDFGDRAIGRVTPVDSAMWWMILLRAARELLVDTESNKKPSMILPLSACTGRTPETLVARNNSRSLRYQAVFMVQTAEHRASHDLQVVWNAMSMLVWRNGKIGWRVWDSGTKAGMGPSSIVMRHPFFQDAAHLLLCC